MPHKPHRRGDEKPRINRRKWLQALGVGGAAGLAGCTGGGGDTETEAMTEASTETPTEEDALGGDTDTPTEQESLPEVSGTYTGVTSSPYQTLNPLYNTEAGAGTAIGYALDQTFTFAPGTEYVGQTWESLESDNGEVWVATVRDGLEFGGDYGSVDAETFTYQIQEVQQSEWANTADTDSWTSDINVEQTGEMELQIELAGQNLLYPQSYDPLLFPIPIDLMEPYVNEEDTKGFQEDSDLLELTFTGNLGAFTLDEWERDSGVTYSRTEGYYLQDAEDLPRRFNNAPYFEGVAVDVVQEESSRLAALETGEADSAAVPPNRVAEFQENESTYVNVEPQPYNEVCVYNMRDNGWNAGPGNLFQIKEFRQGLGCAVDKERLLEGVYRGFGEVEYTWQPRWSKWYPGDDNLATYGTGDLYGSEATRSRIESALSESEYDYRYDGDQLVTPEGNQVTLELYHSAGQTTERSFAEFIAQEFSDNAGIKVNVNAINGAQFARNYWAQQVPENPDEYEWSNGQYNAGPREVTSSEAWDMTVVFGLNTYPLNPLTGDVFFIKDSFYNPYGYYPTWDAPGLFEEASNAQSEEELQSVLNEIFVNISEDQPMGMYVFPSDQVGYNASINGPIENFFSGWDFPTWNFEE